MLQKEERGLEGDARLPEGQPHMHHTRRGRQGGEEGVIQEVSKEAIFKEQLQGFIGGKEEEVRRKGEDRIENQEDS